MTMVPDQLVSVDLRKGEYIVQSYSLCKAGYFIGNVKFERLAETVSDGELGEAVLRAKERSVKGVPNPAPREPLPSLVHLLEELGVRTYAQYVKGTKDVGVEFFSGGIVDIAPHRNAGGKDGFVPIADARGTWNNPDAEELGKAVRAGLEVAE